jgi:hypothetical protein
MRGKLISFAQEGVCAGFFLLLAWSGLVILIGTLLSLPGRAVASCGKYIFYGAEKDLDATFLWLEERR